MNCPKENQSDKLFNLAFNYEKGINTGKDEKEAARLYRLAAEQGHAAAAFNLAIMYELGDGIEQNDQEALHFYKLSAGLGFVRAQRILGEIYMEGKMVASNHAEAIKWFQFAAQQKDNESMYQISEIYKQEHNEREALKWLKLAAEHDHMIAQYELALRFDLEKNEQETCKWLELAAEKGHHNAQYKLGIKYQNGEGVKKNKEQAKKWYKLASEKIDGALYAYALICEQEGLNVEKYYRHLVDKGYPHAENWLGEYNFLFHAPRLDQLRYNNSARYFNNMPYDVLLDSVHYFKKAANQGYPRACYNLVLVYEVFKGDLYWCTPDQLFKYCQLAADKGHAAAICKLGTMYSRGFGVKENRKKAFECYKKAAVVYGVPDAQYYLGCMYEEDQNVEEAVKCFKLAAKEGVLRARNLLCTQYPAAADLKDIVGEINERISGKHENPYSEFGYVQRSNEERKRLLAKGLEFVISFEVTDKITRTFKLSSRKTHALTGKKTLLARGLENLLQKNEFTPEEQTKIISLCEAIYSIKRNPLSIFKTHSTNEFQDWLKAKNIKIKPQETIKPRKLYSLLKGDLEKNLMDFIKKPGGTKTLSNASPKSKKKQLSPKLNNTF